MVQFGRFCITGCVGLIVDAGVLSFLLIFALTGPLTGRIVSYILAATVTWILNRTFTFRVSHNVALLQEWVRYVFTNMFGFSLNYAVYASYILLWDTTIQHSILGVTAGSAVGLAANFLSSKFFVFQLGDKDE